MHKIAWATFAHAHAGGLAHTHIPTYAQGSQSAFYVAVAIVIFGIMATAHLLIKQQKLLKSYPQPWSPSGRPRRPYLRIVK